MRAITICTVSFLIILSGLFTSCTDRSDLKKNGLKGKVKSIYESSSNPKNVFGKWESNGNVLWTVRMNFDEKGKYLGMEVGDNKIIPKYENEIKVEESQYMKNGDLINTSKFQNISEDEIECNRFEGDKIVVNIKSFYENNRLSKMIYTSLYPNDNTKYTEQYTYDKNDNMIEAKRIDMNGERVSRYEYPEFDDKKNWTRQLVYNSKNDEKPSVIVIRQIEYY